MTLKHQLHTHNIIQKLDYRVQLLETALRIVPGGRIVLEFGDTRLTINNNEIVLEAKKITLRAAEGIHLVSDHVVDVKAGGNIVLKGSKIIQD